VKLDATRRANLPSVDENYEKQSLYNELMEANSARKLTSPGLAPDNLWNSRNLFRRNRGRI
jgi:hypothetical protein